MAAETISSLQKYQKHFTVFTQSVLEVNVVVNHENLTAVDSETVCLRTEDKKKRIKMDLKKPKKTSE